MLIKSYSEIVQFNHPLLNCQPKSITNDYQNPNVINGEYSRIIGDKFEVEVFYELLSNINNRKRPSMIVENSQMKQKAKISSELILNHVSFIPKKIKYYESRCGKKAYHGILH